MPAKARFPGICSYCGAEATRPTAPKHLKTCRKRKALLKRKTGGKRSIFEAEAYHIRAEATYLPEFWLDLEVQGDATLEHLDQYLRAIWLECCGHMSAFFLGGWGTPQLAKEGFVSSVFRHRAKIMHVYDFGTESWTTLKRIGVREGRLTTNMPISLMVRNKLPDVRCLECGESAGWLCVQCVIEEDVMGFLCRRHTRTHDHREYGKPLKVVNSPRIGLCGYTGPAKPPY
ncbi:MAG: hypothetical protein A3F84_18925 [Candidatus Handelsmanbacteria bacterium RIFCSPLOWO2_12_FULL_64_10]|uniref:Uncharacterized protein n=1 Tax=Handelsmanbacteria sp. (strain RIFCSPLOWO2_12_FULL_64_10) TaxID=1817868 RepID=A0A1F6C4J7_HANXR|nr:MAG: hypothetical protein A3F84_18925 [Candidatus Handelsmanbacteria bacterium RIFCSPLOWO2_12_FULL_64_10]